MMSLTIDFSYCFDIECCLGNEVSVRRNNSCRGKGLLWVWVFTVAVGLVVARLVGSAAPTTLAVVQSKHRFVVRGQSAKLLKL